MELERRVVRREFDTQQRTTERGRDRSSKSIVFPDYQLFVHLAVHTSPWHNVTLGWADRAEQVINNVWLLHHPPVTGFETGSWWAHRESGSWVHVV